jgi:MtrB/PioB family decaheme-associated outer membrane protein
VVTDSFVNPISQTNSPYSFQRNNGELSFDYRFAGRHKLEVGYDRLSYRRTFQDISQTKQDTLFGQIDIFKKERFGMNLKLAWSERDGSAYDPDDDVNPPENPGLRRYNMADRERSTAKLFFMALPSDTFNFGGSFEWADDNYGAEYGRTSGEYSAYNLDASWTPASNVVVFGWYSYEDIEASVDGDDRLLGGSVDWFASTRDELDTLGIGIEAQKIGGKWDLGADFNASRTTGAYNVQIADDPMAPFPNLLTNLESLRLYAIYSWRPKWDVGFNARYDRFHSDDWALDNVDADTIFNVLTLGNDAPNYDVSVVGVWVRYSFP